MADNSLTGVLSKMKTDLQSPVLYQLPVGDELLPLNELIGQKITMAFDGDIFCSHCGRKTKKSFSQGYCYPCFKKLPQCDTCIMSPEKCHYHEGTCRDSQWGDTFCMTGHVVYLANSSGLKVGITRASQVPVRWIDQGATQAMPFIRVATRQQSGFLESLFKESVSDRTNWRVMLKGPAEPLDLPAMARELFDMNASRIKEMQDRFGLQAIQPVQAPEVIEICYPVAEYPGKITSQSFDKKPLIEGTLMGIKGQYLMLDTGVVNIRRHTSYRVCISAG